MVRVLHVLGGLGLGGAESRIMDLYREMNREEIQFDFLVHSGNLKKVTDSMENREPQFYDQEVTALGGHIYVLPRFKVYNYFTYRKAVKNFFAEHKEFQVVQGHMTSTAGIYLPIAKQAGIPITVAHSRNANVVGGLRGLATRMFRKNLNQKADYLFACSKLAAEDAFGAEVLAHGDVHIIHNAIDVERFRYNPAVRDMMRKKLGVEDKIVLGHVGRFDTQKNHPYLMQIMEELVKRQDNFVLVCLGDVDKNNGPQIRELAKSFGIADKVLFEGNRKNTEEYYQAFDFFLLPSLYEGLPGVLVEAQAAGLKCFVSDTVTREAVGTNLVTYLPIDGAPSVWSDAVIQALDYNREDTCESMKKSGFDVKIQAKAYRKFYQAGDVSDL